MKRLSLLLLVAPTLAACGGDGGAGTAVFERAQRSLADVDALRAHLTVHAFVSIDRRMTIDRADLPVDRLHLVKWAKHPRPFACGHGFECARADLDVETAVRELEPLLPSLPIDPASVDSASVEVRLDSRGELHRIDVEGELAGADAELDLRPAG